LSAHPHTVSAQVCTTVPIVDTAISQHWFMRSHAHENNTATCRHNISQQKYRNICVVLIYEDWTWPYINIRGGGGDGFNDPLSTFTRKCWEIFSLDKSTNTVICIAYKRTNVAVRCVRRAENVFKCVCDRDSAPDRAGAHIQRSYLDLGEGKE